MRDESKPVKAPAFAPAIGEHNQDILDDITYGIENLQDSNDIVEAENNNVRKHSEGKESMIWPNRNNNMTLGMAAGLEALEVLGSSSYKPDASVLRSKAPSEVTHFDGKATDASVLRSKDPKENDNK